MNFQQVAEKARQRAAASPRIRKLAGKPPLVQAPPAAPPEGQTSNSSYWVVPDEAMWPIPELYGSFEVPALSYGTVRDFADSSENMPGLAGANFDMKDMQRSWMTKAIVGSVPRGAKLLEIGAGEPLVAGILSRLGYDVTVVDPYDGSGNGPREYEQFTAAYPDVRFIREQFPPAEDLGDDFGAVYSISVLEHVPLEALDAVIAGARRMIAGVDGRSIHAVDHVLAGWGSDSHLAGLRKIVEDSGLPLADLDATIEQLRDDPETYFVSAESHNRWRGGLPYDEYAMRRIVSVNINAGP
jgi:hypothetical protein